MEMGSYKHGQFSWVDLQAPDVDKAKHFYTSLFGWDARDEHDPDGNYVYTMFLQTGMPTCGMGPQTEDMKNAEMPPVWSSYINVDDCAAVVAKAKSAGANVMLDTMEVFETGTMAFVLDPTGGAIGLWQPRNHKGAGVVNEPGALCWNELATHDVEKAKTFYAAVFDWEPEKIGDEPEYWVVKNEGEMNGGIVKIPEQAKDAPPYWAVYFASANTDDTVEKCKELGGDVVMPATDIPQGRMAVLRDDQGGMFSVIQLAQPPT